MKRQRLEWEVSDLSSSAVVLGVEVENRSVRHIGRALTGKILKFIDVKPPIRGDYKLAPGELIPREDAFAVERVGFHGFRYIIGPPGVGKSTSLCAAFKYLSAVYQAETPATRRIVFVSGAEAGNNAEDAVSSAIEQACADDDADEQRQLFARSRRIIQFLKRSRLRYTLVVDDGNKFSAGSAAALFLASLVPACQLVLCASASTDWMDKIRHPKTHDYLIVNESLVGEELAAFCQRQGIDLKQTDLRRTGTNPRLLLTYNHDMQEFESSITALQKGADEFLARAVQTMSSRNELLADMTGVGTLPLLSTVYDTKCLFVGEDLMLDCISEELRVYCTRKLVQVIEEHDLASACELIALVTGRIRQDRNTIRIGWNAEEATLLAVKLLKLDLLYKTDEVVSIGEPSFVLFRGQMSAAMLRGAMTGSRLYAPAGLTHIGLDFYVELADAVIAFQVSVARNAESRHLHTVEKAEDLFRAAGKQFNILVFVIPCQFSSSLVEKPGCKYYYVTMAFGDLSSRLKVIDDTVAEIRGSAAHSEVCSSCQKAPARCDDWVQCDVCLLWYHVSCVGVDAAEAKSRDYECYQCKDFFRRKRQMRG